MADRRTLQRRLRFVCWVVLVTAVVAALQTPRTTAPGGPTLGLALAGILYLTLRFTQPKGRKR